MDWEHKLNCDCSRCQGYRADNCRPGCDCGMCRKARREGSSCGGGCSCASCDPVGEAVAGAIARVVVGGLITTVLGGADGGAAMFS